MSDAFSAGVTPGGLYNAEEIKILLCYMLHTVEQPIQRDQVTGIITAEGLANYFDTEEAIEDRQLATTVTGAQIGESLSVRVPYTVRDRAVNAALQLLKRRAIERENKVEIQRLDASGFEVTCIVQDQTVDLLRVTLRVTDEWQAKQIKEQFLTDPSLLYRSTLAVLTGDAALRRANTQLVIKLD